MIKTEMFLEAYGEDGAEAIAVDIPLGMGTPEDIAAAAVYLASDEAKHVTGAVLDVNGGVYFR